MEKKTTLISADKFRPLEIEWIDLNEKPGHGTFRIMPDGTSKRLNGKEVSLVHPGGAFAGRSRILNLDPQTALNLLHWLESEKETLEAEAKIEYDLSTFSIMVANQYKEHW